MDWGRDLREPKSLQQLRGDVAKGEELNTGLIEGKERKTHLQRRVFLSIYTKLTGTPVHFHQKIGSQESKPEIHPTFKK